MKKAIQIALEKEIVTSSIKVALVVGIILNLINQGENLVTFNFKQLNLLKFFVTFSVPYLVSTYASVKVKLGSALVGNSQQPMQGITYLLEVVQKDSMNLNANFALGKFGNISGQYDKAIERYQQVVEIDADNLRAYYAMAQINPFPHCKSY